jgi:hypothetical protein
MMKERLRAWSNSNRNTLPTDILWFRDGVSESRLDKCTTTGILQINQAYEDVLKELREEGHGNEAKGKKPQVAKLYNLTFVVVGKRHHTRFYAKDNLSTYTVSKN